MTRGPSIKRWRLRLPRFSLRALLFVFAILALPLCFEAYRQHRRLSAEAFLTERKLCVVRHEFPIAEYPRPFFHWYWHELPAPWCIRYWKIMSPLCGLRHCGYHSSDTWFREEVLDWIEEHGPPAPDPTPAERRQIIAAIAVLAELSEVVLTFPLDDDDLRVVATLPDLNDFSFKTQGLTESSIEHLLKIPLLFTLVIEYDRLDDVPIDVLTKLRAHAELDHLILNGPCRGEDLIRLQDALPYVHVVARPRVETTRKRQARQRDPVPRPGNGS
jgi:hypothetical protein